jgi:hypothetical protein
MDNEQESYSMDLILGLAEQFHRLVVLDESAPLTSPPEGTCVLSDIEEFVKKLIDLQLQDSYHLAGERLGRLKAELRYTDMEVLDGHRESLLQAVAEVMDMVRSEAENRKLYPVINEYRFHRFEAPDFMDPPIPLSVERFLEQARQCWMVGFESAAVMHTLLATEVLTRHFYSIEYENGSEGQTWGEVVGNLAASNLRDLLDHIVKDYRNKIMHGELEVHRDMAMEVFAECAKASDDMVAMLRENDRVRSAPTETEQKAILLVARYIIHKQVSQETLIQVLLGISTEVIQDQVWNQLPAYGALEDNSFRWVQDKVDWLRNNHKLSVSYNIHTNQSYIDYANDEVREEISQLFVDELMRLLYNEDEDGLQDFYAWVLKSPKGVKNAFLDRVRQDDLIELGDVLEYWFKREPVKKTRSKINETRQAMGLEPISHSSYTGD